MFGELVFSNKEGCTEYILCDENNKQIVVCYQDGNIKMYRLSWILPDGYEHNTSCRTLMDAIEFMQAVSIGQWMSIHKRI